MLSLQTLIENPLYHASQEVLLISNYIAFQYIIGAGPDLRNAVQSGKYGSMITL